MRRQTDKTNPPAKPMKVQAPMTVLRRTTTTSGPAPYWRMNPRMVLAFVLPAVIFIVSSLDLNPRLQTGRGFSRFFVHRLTP